MNDDLPKGVLSEEKYKIASKKLVKIAKILMIVGACLFLTVSIGSYLLMDSCSKVGGGADATAQVEDLQAQYDAKLAEEKAAWDKSIASAKELFAKIDAEKEAILPGYTIQSVQSEAFSSGKDKDVKAVDIKYATEIKAVEKQLDLIGVNVSGGGMYEYKIFGSTEFGVSRSGSAELKALESELASAKDNIELGESIPGSSVFRTASVLQSVIFGVFAGMPFVVTGGIMMLIGKQREIAAHQAQAIIPVAGESAEKMSGYAGRAAGNAMNEFGKTGGAETVGKMFGAMGEGIGKGIATTKDGDKEENTDK